MAARPIRVCIPPPNTTDRGGTLLGYAGVVLVVGALGVTLFASTDFGGRIVTGIERAVCAVLDLGGCPPGRGVAEDFLPEPCTTDAQQLSASVSISIAASPSGRVRIGERVNSDGTAEVSLTHALHGSADAPSPLRWGADLGPLADAHAGVGAGMHGGLAATRTWTFRTERAADRFRKRVARAEHLQNLGSDSGAFDALGARIVGVAADRLGGDSAGDLPPPDRREVSVNAGVHLTGEAGAKFGLRRSGRSAEAGPHGPTSPADGRTADPGSTDADTGGDPSADPGSRRDGVSSSLNLLHLVSAGAEGEAVLTESVDERSGTVSQTVGFTFAEAGEVGPLMPKSVLRPRDARDRLARASLTTTRDRATGELVAITIETVNTDEDRGHIAGTTRLEVTGANRAAVRRWLAGSRPLAALEFLATTGRPKDITSPAAQRSDDIGEFDRLLFSEATYSTVRYAAESNGREFGADATLSGWTFGGATGWESLTRTATGARYLAGPGPAGRRELVPFEDCAD
ncbi:hypothetical protein FZ103_15365 [Streptomonospora sp. PA3]|uniref:hypothetical protein n=1 Tax=Streptomonospora sp. PA3 TaxID=2607326 RepID=UPI0012DD1A73|nr:hypothetical protein [Streptomonospora sp. PA3]MUL42534.1 hypothetical protein [Streptomonospora sp. PA3]